MEIQITKENFKEEVLESKKPILVDFWATWCGPCQMLNPILEEISEEQDEIRIGKINVDEQEDLAIEYRIMNIPAMILFKDGKAVKSMIGYHTKEEILENLK